MASDPDHSLPTAARRQPLLALGAGLAPLVAIAAGAGGLLTRDLELSTLLGLIGGAASLASVALVGAWLVNGARVRLADALDVQAKAGERGVPAGDGGLLSGAGGDPAMLVAGETRRLGLIATWGQAVATLPLAALALVEVWLLRPSPLTTSAANAGEFAVGVSAVVLGFPLLLLERRLHGLDRTRFREAHAIARLLRLGVWTLVLGGGAAVCRALDVEAAAWIQWVLGGLIALTGAELILRGIVAPFLPIARSHEAHGLGDSALGGLLLTRGTGGGFGQGLKERFGIDLSQSWAVRFLRRAALPLLAVLAVVGWLLSGVTALAVGERGVYERCGAPVAVLTPGLHAHLPWPFGVVRRVDFGQIHELALGLDPESPDQAAIPVVDADADTPAQFDRLWDRQHPTDATYLVPGESASGNQAAVGYQLMNCDVRVLWRVRLSDDGARDAVYQVAAPTTLVRGEAQRLLQRSFATQPLSALIGEDRDLLAGRLRGELQAALDGARAGIEITSVVVDAIHPPVDAVPAYHGVQAAEIGALTDISRARGEAATIIARAQGQAAVSLLSGQAVAGEKVATANADTIRFNADRLAFAAAPEAMRLERWLQAVGKALAKGNLVVVDHRLVIDGGPAIDLRKYPGNE